MSEDFSVAQELRLEVDDASLRSAREKIESEINDPVARLEVGGGSAGSLRGGGTPGRGSGSIGGITGGLDDIEDELETANDHLDTAVMALQDIVDCVCGSDGGGNLRPPRRGPPGGGGGGGGGFLGGVGAGAGATILGGAGYYVNERMTDPPDDTPPDPDAPGGGVPVPPRNPAGPGAPRPTEPTGSTPGETPGGEPTGGPTGTGDPFITDRPDRLPQDSPEPDVPPSPITPPTPDTPGDGTPGAPPVSATPLDDLAGESGAEVEIPAPESPELAVPTSDPSELSVPTDTGRSELDVPGSGVVNELPLPSREQIGLGGAAISAGGLLSGLGGGPGAGTITGSAAASTLAPAAAPLLGLARGVTMSEQERREGRVGLGPASGVFDRLTGPLQGPVLGDSLNPQTTSLDAGSSGGGTQVNLTVNNNTTVESSRNDSDQRVRRVAREEAEAMRQRIEKRLGVPGR